MFAFCLLKLTERQHVCLPSAKANGEIASLPSVSSDSYNRVTACKPSVTNGKTACLPSVKLMERQLV
jgi:hypothetical protein